MNPSAEKILSRAGAWRRFSLQTLAGAGSFARAQWDEVRHAAAVIGTLLYTSIRPQYWTSNVRKTFARQIMAIGVEPLAFVCAVAVFVGISVVVQLTFWVG
jgi:ABC-type transporter Mla maintaining outer membrane lipid asymmetry permease subunit MlaE